MKANQAFRENDEAVSPVIGVILMVAITVVLAAVVFVLVTKLSSNQSSTTPNFGFQPDNAAKTVRITTAEAGTKWDQIKATVTCSAGNPSLTKNGAAVANFASGVADPVELTALPASNVNGGSDVLGVACSTTTAGTTVSLVLTYKPSNTQIGTTWTFTY